jgi:hypothetical protein
MVVLLSLLLLHENVFFTPMRESEFRNHDISRDLELHGPKGPPFPLDTTMFLFFKLEKLQVVKSKICY